MDLAKLLLIFNLGIAHPATTGAFEAYTFSYQNPKWDIINSGNDHAWLFGSRASVLLGAGSAFFWGKKKPKFKEVLLTSIGTALIADAVRNVIFRGVKDGKPFAIAKIPDFKGFGFTFTGIQGDGKLRIAEFAIGAGFIVISELTKK